ncbi:MAG: efflux RND transporter periplasmic adaptor subunit [Rhodospirillaceae bacterium]
MRKIWSVALVLPVLGFLQACEEPVEPPPERIRAIKSITVTEAVDGVQRVYAGQIAAAQTSPLSFAVSGTVETVSVEEGDAVRVGQVLAELDPSSFDLDVASAESELASAEAKYEEARLEFDRQSELFDKGWVAKAAFDTAQSAAQTARASVEIARSQLGQAQRNLDKTKILAPFDGVVALRSIEPFVEVSVGTTAFEVNASGGLEVEFAVPDQVVGRIARGQSVEINASAITGCGCTGRVIEIGSVASEANTVSVKASVERPPEGLLPGMATSTTLILAGPGESEGGYLVPLSAIAPGAETGTGFVFKFDQETGTVSKTAVRGREGQDNKIAILEGVDVGDIIAIAGVSFLRDGQQVTLLAE